MPDSVRTSLPMLLVLFVATTAPSFSVAQSNERVATDDERAIQRIVTTFESGWNTHDMGRIGSVFRDDAEFINVVGMFWRGKAAIVKAHAVYHEIMFKDCRLHSDALQIRLLNDTTAIAVWTVTQDSFKTPSGNVVPKTQTRLTFVLTKADDGWRVAHGHNTRIDAEAAQFDPVNANENK